MKHFLLNLDYLSVEPQVYFKSKRKFSTWTGLFFSFFIGMAIFILGIFFFKECTDKITYFLTSTEEFIANENANLSKLGFDVIFDVRNGWIEPFPEFERYFSIQLIGKSNKIQNMTKCTLRDKGFVPTNNTLELHGINWCFKKEM